MPQLNYPTTKQPNRPNMTTTTTICAVLAAGLALALSREHRIRRAFQTLAARLLDKLRRQDHTTPAKHPTHSPRRHP